ncbi:MAG: flagellar biosynthesis protein FlhF [Variovorax sp.]|nr:flagellar biosynthesis protein FlhF [Variovorax sp.]
MNIQRFLAPTAREALAKARAAFGDDTLILSNRQVPDGVEVMAATEAALALIDSNTPEHGSHGSHGSVEATRSAPVPAPNAMVEAAAAPALDIGVQADTEQLAMSTLSFQDYVRERMLRRQHEASAPANAAAAPVVAEAAPQAVRAQSGRPGLQVQSSPVVAVAVNDFIASTATLAAAPASAATEPTPNPEPAPLHVNAAASTAGAIASPDLMAQLQSMKDMMDERFSALAWLGQARQDPIQSNLMLKLVRAGYSPGLARSVLEAMPRSLEAGDAVRWLLESLENRLSSKAVLPSIPEEGGVFALIGATGVGKTTSAAKLAALGAQMHGAAGVGLITLDTQRAGAHEQLRAHGRSLGLVAHLAHDRAALQELLSLLSAKKVVIIDTAGVAPHDPRRRDVLDMVDLPSVKRVLVLNAGAHGDTLEDMAIAFKLGGTRQAIVSKIDEAAKLGPVLDVLMRHEFTVRGIGNGQRVPEDWKVGDARGLVRASMQAAQRSAFDPKPVDMPCYFSPADCGA